MACELKCECFDYAETEIKTFSQYKEIESFFLLNIKKRNFIELKPNIPYYSFGEIFWYADKWYRCTYAAACGNIRNLIFRQMDLLENFQTELT